MTREQAIVFLTNLYVYEAKGSDYKKVIDMAIDAILKISEIESIISIDNSIIQEDVIKYKMICEVIKYEGYN